MDMSSQHRIAHRMARILEKFPLLAHVARLIFRWLQARYTAGVIGVVYNDSGQILLVEHAFHPKNAWGLPGGWLGHLESPSTALKRELIEELGLELDFIHIKWQNIKYPRGHATRQWK